MALMTRKSLLAIIVLFLFCFTVSAQDVAPSPETKAEQKLSIGIAADNSGSFRKVLDYLVEAVQQMGQDLQTDDEAFLVRFTSKDKIEILQEFTDSKSSLSTAADEMYIEGGQTAISEAVLFTAKHLVENGKNERKVMILITDGESVSDKKTHAETVKYLKENNVQVFILAITITLDSNVRESIKFMDKLASETGGSVVTVERGKASGDVAKTLMKAVRGK